MFRTSLAIDIETAPLHITAMILLTLMRTTEVGVATFSLTLNTRVRTLNVQMSSPLPTKPVATPPMNPVYLYLAIIVGCMIISKFI